MRWAKKGVWPPVFAHFGIKTRSFFTLWELSSKLFRVTGASSTRWWVAKDNANRGNTLKLEAKVEFLEGFFHICVCGNGGFECFTRFTLTEKRAKAFTLRHAQVYYLFSEMYNTFVRAWDSLACVYEERFLRKGRGKSHFTFKSYCQDRTYPKYMPYIFYGWLVAIWFAGDFLQSSKLDRLHEISYSSALDL